MMEKLLREHQERMKEISRKSILSFGTLGKLNLQQIFFMSNAKVHPSSQMKKEQMNILLDHIDETGGKDVTV